MRAVLWRTFRYESRSALVAAVRRNRQPLLSLAAFLAVCLVALAVWRARWPVVIVVNTSAEPARLVVDASGARSIPPTSVETPYAGASLALSPGHHRFVVTAPDGTPLDARDVRVDAGVQYLYAPADTGQCFWIQRTGYGRARAPGPALRPLRPESKLWEIPTAIDAWFVANPPADETDKVSSGGVRVAVRQVRCGAEPW